MHVGFREILYQKGDRKVEELVMLHLHFTPHCPHDIIAAGVGVAVGVLGER